MFGSILDVIIFIIYTVGIGTYLCQWVNLMYEIIEGEVKSKRDIVWKIIPYGFLILVVWKWQELSKEEVVYDAEVIDAEEEETNDDTRLKVYNSRK